MGVSQAKLVMGFGTQGSAYNDMHHVAIVFNEIFGAAPSSKLFLNVRERLGLCYYCSSSYSIFSGNIIVSCGTDIKNCNVAEQEILDQLKQIQLGNVSDDEISCAKKSLLNWYSQIEDSTAALFGFYSGRQRTDIQESLTQFTQKISGVTKKDICDFATGVFYDTRFCINPMLSGVSKEEFCDE